ncbi:macrophage mannose receptor 1-like isoform X1 [Eriocheir sinensis]|uniref:macrophage mannose receptor 1-like isoform X1 n=1 Tax=Eriocheir sinensis TaxID=95602 RepID=UPI0021C9D01E|nr:macrophage mannose receptor 1-like isoform X1 [Eriocheir sinensis]
MVMFSLLILAGLVATSLSSPFPAVREYPRLECPEGWALIDRTCFLLADEAGTWDEGQSFCNQRSASLATISSQTQQVAITAMLSQSVWIGLNDRKEENTFVWADGSDYNYASWNDENPSNFQDAEHCVESRKSYGYLWNDNSCNNTMKFLCSKPPELVITANKTATTTTTTTPAPVCEEGWEMFEDTMCYKVSDGLASWPRAREACLAQYAQLAAVTSKGQQNFLAARLTGNTWIGLNDEVKEGTFTWQDGTEPGYTNWDEDQPDNYLHSKNEDAAENCVEIRPPFGYRWNDQMCHIKKQFVCQKPPSKTCVLPTSLSASQKH